ncbi:hypothetical protein C4588_07265 [Candidatus Parcubacteria bacterium]|nr:MAG: hypothetical protein C4588_07265 [Candidatus Parcubacteria bacterium]
MQSMFRGSPIQRTFNIANTVVINPGDLVWWDGATLKPVGTSDGLVETWGTLRNSRRNVVSRFAGIADFEMNTTYRHSITRNVNSGAIAMVAVPSGTYKVGDLLGPAQDGGNNWLLSTSLIKVVHPFDAIAMVTKDYPSAVTRVEAMLWAAWDPGHPRFQVKTIPLFAGPMGTAADIVSDYTFGERGRLVAAKAVTTVVFDTADTILTFKNAANSLDDTLTIATSGSAVGTFDEVLFDDANDYNIFEHDSLLDVASDGGTTAGQALLSVEFWSHGAIL